MLRSRKTTSFTLTELILIGIGSVLFALLCPAPASAVAINVDAVDEVQISAVCQTHQATSALPPDIRRPEVFTSDSAPAPTPSEPVYSDGVGTHRFDHTALF